MSDVLTYLQQRSASIASVARSDVRHRKKKKEKTGYFRPNCICRAVRIGMTYLCLRTSRMAAFLFAASDFFISLAW